MTHADPLAPVNQTGVGTPATQQAQQRPVGVLALYGGSWFGLQILYWPTTALLLYYLTQFVGMGVAMATAVLTIPKVWDFLTDPVVSDWTDRRAQRLGSRSASLWGAGLLMALASIATFSVPALSSAATAAWTTLMLIVITTCFTVYFVNHVALSDDIDHAGIAPRDTALALRAACQGAGGLLAGAAGPQLIEQAGGGRPGYMAMALVLGGVGAVLAGSAAWVAKQVPVRACISVAAAAPPLWQSMKAASRNAMAMALLASNFLVYLATTFLSAALPFVNRYVLGAGDGQLSLLFSSLMGSMICGAPVAALLTRRFSRVLVFNAGAAVMAAAAVLLYVVSGSVGLVGLMVGLGLWGLGLGIYATLLNSCLIDAVRLRERDSGVSVGLLLGLNGSLGKIGDTLGGVLVGVVLAGLALAANQQPSAAAISQLRASFGLLPAGLMLLSVLPVWWVLRRGGAKRGEIEE